MHQSNFESKVNKISVKEQENEPSKEVEINTLQKDKASSSRVRKYE